MKQVPSSREECAPAFNTIESNSTTGPAGPCDESRNDRSKRKPERACARSCVRTGSRRVSSTHLHNRGDQDQRDQRGQNKNCNYHPAQRSQILFGPVFFRPVDRHARDSRKMSGGFGWANPLQEATEVVETCSLITRFAVTLRLSLLGPVPVRAGRELFCGRRL